MAPSGRPFGWFGDGQASKVVGGLGCLAAGCEECPSVGLQELNPVGDVARIPNVTIKADSAHRNAAPIASRVGPVADSIAWRVYGGMLAPLPAYVGEALASRLYGRTSPARLIRID